MRVTRFRAVIVVASAVAALVVAAIVSGRLPEQARATPSATPIATPSPSVSASSTSSALPIASASPAPVPTPAVASPPALATIAPDQLDAFVPAQTRGIGQLSGDWVFMLRRSTVFGTLPSGAVTATDHAVDSLVFVPLARPETGAVAVATFLSNLGGGIAATNLIGAQLSPDGRRVVLSVATKGPQGGERLGLVIIDLASGNTSNLTTDPSYHDDTPAWSPDGQWIAFSRRTVSDGRDAGLWNISTRSGADAFPRLITVHATDPRSFVYRWTPDGRSLAILTSDGRYGFIDPFPSCPIPGPASCFAAATTFAGLSSGPRDAADWRQPVPQFAGVFVESARGGVQTIEVADGIATPPRVVVRTANANTLLERPRWRPGSDDILYTQTPAGTGTRIAQLMVANARTGVARQVGSHQRPLYAEWTPSGDEIVWVEASGVAVAVRLVRADGSGERAIYGTGGAPEAQVITVDFGTLRF
jgi:dipeptidyl aminopeptidase/acylaminoacyl peptidase